jgi:hypothetical protein
MTNVRARLEGVDPDWQEMVVDIDISRVAGYKKPRHFVEAYYYGAAITQEVVASGVVSCQGSAAHFYLIDGQVVTHPNSARAAKKNVRAAVSADPRRRLQFEAIRWMRHYAPGSGSILRPAGG